ncbi:hypothetical protein VTN00DRAFT_1368 [Thermoascus crustaceus]|uniref:uncharacterized protein n=1 Tax=Thermoascus crustaceus TaxID=5088 RepID=UPI0037448BBA
MTAVMNMTMGKEKRNKTGSGTYVVDKKACVMMTREAKKKGGMDESERNARKKQHTLPTQTRKAGKKTPGSFYSSTSNHTHKRSCHVTIAAISKMWQAISPAAVRLPLFLTPKLTLGRC